MRKPIQRILAQGHFDGLCLIYSLFNAVIRSVIACLEKTAA